MSKPASPSFVSLKWRGSLFLWLAEALEVVLVGLSPVAWIAHCRRKSLPMWAVDLWVSVLCAGSAGLVFSFNSFGESGQMVATGVAVYLLLESLGLLLRDVVGSPAMNADQSGPFIGIREPRRLIIMAPIGLIPIVLAFATLYLACGACFESPIDQPLQAAYYSMVTLTTLGYGDHHPISDAGRGIVMAELGFFLLFVVIKLPIFMSVIRVKTIGGGVVVPNTPLQPTSGAQTLGEVRRD